MAMQQMTDAMPKQMGRPKLPEDQRKQLKTVMLSPEMIEAIKDLVGVEGKTEGEVHRKALEIGLTALGATLRRS